MMLLSSRFRSSFTRSNRCFMRKVESREFVVERRNLPPSGSQLSTTSSQPSQFLRDGFEQIALDDVAHLIFAEISQLDAAFETNPDFFHVVLETAKRGETAVVNRLALAQHPGARSPRNPAVGDEASGHDALAQLENLFHLGVADDRLPMFRIEQTGHRFLNLVDQFVNDAVELDLH